MAPTQHSSWHALARDLVHAHGAGRAGHPAPASEDHTVFQTSTITALLAGVYDGDLTIAELLAHGDFGLGTFNALDGEMVVLDGVCHHVRADGTATEATGTDRTPFAAVLEFVTDREADLRHSDRAALFATLDDLLDDDPNITWAIRVDATFSRVLTRTVARQHQPYPPLTEAAAHQATTGFRDVAGTLVGFRTPRYEANIAVAGYHLHFLTADRRRGGHALDLTLEQGRVRLCAARGLHLSLPPSAAFAHADLAGDDTQARIRQAEGGTG